MKTVAIIQARMGSNRLPGKVLADLGGRPALGWVVRAARAVPAIDAVWVATSVGAGDDPIAAWCEANQVPVCRGAEQDVLERYAKAIAASGAEVVVRITADCPFFDPAVAGQAIRLRQVTGADYASNVDPQTWPDGLDCEVVTASALLAAAAEAKRPSDREHVTPFVRNNRARFSWETLIAPLPGLRAERWTLDTPEDLEFLRQVARRLPADHVPSYLEILAVLDREPALRDLNRGEVRNAGYAAGVAADLMRTERAFDRSREMIARAERVIPLGSQTFSKSRLQLPPGAAPLFASHGDGGRIYDIDGNEYVDMVNALLPNVLGYRDLDVDTAIRRQLTRGISLSLPSTLETELAERLTRHIPCAEMARFGKNGTDATSAAIRLARASTRRDRVITLGYHGWQDWYIGATTRNLGVPSAVSALTHVAPYGDLAAVEKLLQAHPDEFAAVILEPAGATEPAAGYLESLKALVHRHGALLVFDEIITGFRWALGGAQARYGVTPDLACFGKAMGNGMPISAVVGRADVLRLMEQVFYSGTFGGETLSLAAAIATIDKIERDNVIARLWQTGAELLAGARSRVAAAGLADTIGFVGVAPWAILTFKDHARASRDAVKTLFLREMIQAGVLVNASHNVCYAHSAADIAHVLAAYDRTLPVVREALERGDLEQRLAGQVIRPVFAVRAAP
jgi:glutamate-1-semialdehyde 2,1-aminomutase/spore coat polysaccharide biosynthesis protein SpsF